MLLRRDRPQDSGGAREVGVGQQLEPRRRGGKRGEDEQRVRVNSDGVGEERSATSQSMAERTRLLATTFRGTRATTCAS